jgi:hypothetical protein
MAEKLFFCNVPDCKHAQDKIPSLPFSRHDKLLQHQRLVGHGDCVNSNRANRSQSEDTTPVASGSNDGDTQVQTQTQMQMQIQGAPHLSVPVEVQADGEEEAVVLSRNMNLGEAGGNLLAKVKAMQDRHAAEIKRLKVEQEREMSVLRKELENYEREIAIVREFLGD